MTSKTVVHITFPEMHIMEHDVSNGYINYNRYKDTGKPCVAPATAEISPPDHDAMEHHRLKIIEFHCTANYMPKMRQRIPGLVWSPPNSVGYQTCYIALESGLNDLLDAEADSRSQSIIKRMTVKLSDAKQAYNRLRTEYNDFWDKPWYKRVWFALIGYKLENDNEL